MTGKSGEAFWDGIQAEKAFNMQAFVLASLGIENDAQEYCSMYVFFDIRSLKLGALRSSWKG